MIKSIGQALQKQYVVFCLLFGLFAIHAIFQLQQNKGIVTGENIWSQWTIESLLHDHDIDIENNIKIQCTLCGQLALTKTGILISKQDIRLALISLPFYAAFGEYGLLLLNLFIVSTILYCIYLICKIQSNHFSALIVCLLFTLFSVFLDYSFMFNADTFAVGLFLVALVLYYRSKLFWAAILMATALSVRFTFIAPCIAFIVFELLNTKETLQSKMLFLLFFALGLIPLLLFNYHYFNDPFSSAYQHMLSGIKDGTIATSSTFNKYNQPLFRGLYNILFNPNEGIIVPNLLICSLAVIGAVVSFFRKNSPVLRLAALFIASQLLLAAKYDEWQSSTVSSRYLLLGLALSSIFVLIPVEYLVNYFSNKRLTSHVSDLSKGPGSQ